MNTFCFGKGAGCASAGYVPDAPYNLGRTVTHELGHFFNLDHTFAGCGTSATCATTGDRVCDTPAVNVETYGCPALGSVPGCVAGQSSLTMNYMDYVNDACMYMFTAGQKTRANARVNVVYSQYVTNTLSKEKINTIAFSLIPNPSNGLINIQFDNLISDYNVEIYDVMGREVNFKKLENNDSKMILLDTVAKGIYYVTITADDLQTTKKIVIE